MSSVSVDVSDFESIGRKRSFSVSGGNEDVIIEDPERFDMDYISLTTHREQFGSVNKQINRKPQTYNHFFI
jgi:hypothetical protein